MNDSPEQLGAQLSEAYVRLRQRDHPAYKISAADSGRFKALAGRLIDRGIADPMNYLSWIFEFHRRTRPVVYVQMVTAPRMVQMYQKRVNQDEVSLEIQLQIDTLRTQLALGRDAREIITDPHLELGAVFRYALARRAQLQELAERFKCDAKLAMDMSSDYRRFFESFTGSTE